MADENTLEKEGQPEAIADEQGDFYSYGDRNYGTREDLDKAMEESVMFQDRFTQKTQVLGKERSDLGFQREAFQKEQDDFQRKYRNADQYEQFQRWSKDHPEIIEELRTRVGNSASPEGLKAQIRQEMEESYGADLKEIKDWRMQREAEERREAAYSAMEKKYPDFKRESIEKQLVEIAGGDLESVAETLYFSGRGRTSPIEIAEEIQEGLNDKRNGSIPSGASRGTVKKGNPAKTIEESRQNALRALR